MTVPEPTNFDEDEVVLVSVRRAGEVLSEEKVPDLDVGRVLVLNSEPDGPFRFMSTMGDWIEMMARMRQPNFQEE